MNENYNPGPSFKCLWGLPGQLVKSIAPHTEADSMALLSQLLVSFGSIAGRSSFFKAEADRHGCNLFVLNVGNSAKGRKGTSWGQVSNIMKQVDPEWGATRISGGIGSGEALTYMLKDEGSINFGPANSDKRLLILESEFGGFLKVVNREGNTTSPVFRNAWDGTVLRNNTKGNLLSASDHHVSMIGHITMTELNQLLRQTEVMNGLANRFLFFFVKRSGVKPFGGTPPVEDVRLMVEEVKESVSFSREQGEIKRSSQADDLWRDVYPTLSEGLPGIVGSLSSRSEAQVMRLAMILALFNRQKEISIEALECALAIHDYCLESLRFIFGAKLGIPLADRLYDFICESDDGVTRTDVRNFFQKNYPRESINEAIRALSDAKLIEVVQGAATGGRPPEVLRQIKNNKVEPIRLSNDRNDQSPLLSYMSSPEVST